MTGQRKYWKSYAKSNLKGNWGIAIAAMLAVVAVNFYRKYFCCTAVSGRFRICIGIKRNFCVYCISDRNDLQYRIQLYAAEYLQRQGLKPE